MDNKSTDVKVESSTMTDNKEIEQVKQAPETIVKKSVREEKNRKKDDKSVEQVLKALNSLETTEEKLAAMCKKYTDIVDENRKLQLSVKQTEKRLGMVQREKEQLQTEHSKAVLTRSRLESLCRELQRQNKAIKDESLLKIREEEEKRKEVSAKFQSTLGEITALMQQNNEKNSKLREDNVEMTKKFKTVCEQYELREQQVEKITKQMQLETQLADAKLAKAKMEMAAEKEIFLKEKQQLLLDLTEYQAKCQDLQATEVNLRSQISLYTDKYDEFQNALSRSNEVFGGFKGEMEKMSKKICKLEKETSSWKQRWEKSHQALLEMAADKQQRDSELALATRQLAQLQKLCRTLQAERTSLLAQLRTESSGRIADTAAKTNINLESFAPSQEVPCSLNLTTTAEPCRHGPEQDTASTQTQSGESTLTNAILNNSPSAEESISLPVTTDTSQHPVTSSPNQDLSVPENITPVSSNELQSEGVADSNSEPQTSQNEVLSVTSTTNESQSNKNSPENISENELQCLEPIDTKILNEISPVKENETKCDTNSNEGVIINQKTPAEVLVNGQIAEVNANDATDELNEESPGKTTAVDVHNNNAANLTTEQAPVKSSASENKKAKEGAKKRKNK